MVTTATTTPEGEMRNAAQLVHELGMPDVHITAHFGPGGSAIGFHPDTAEDRRRLMGHPAFTAAAWEADRLSSRTVRRGLTIDVYQVTS